MGVTYIPHDSWLEKGLFSLATGLVGDYIANQREKEKNAKLEAFINEANKIMNGGGGGIATGSNAPQGAVPNVTNIASGGLNSPWINALKGNDRGDMPSWASALTSPQLSFDNGANGFIQSQPTYGSSSNGLSGGWQNAINAVMNSGGSVAPVTSGTDVASVATSPVSTELKSRPEWADVLALLDTPRFKGKVSMEDVMKYYAPILQERQAQYDLERKKATDAEFSQMLMEAMAKGDSRLVNQLLSSRMVSGAMDEKSYSAIMNTLKNEFIKQDLGGNVFMGDYNPYGGELRQLEDLKKTFSPDNLTSIRNNELDNKTRLQTTAMNNATSVKVADINAKARSSSSGSANPRTRVETFNGKKYLIDMNTGEPIRELGRAVTSDISEKLLERFKTDTMKSEIQRANQKIENGEKFINGFSDSWGNTIQNSELGQRMKAEGQAELEKIEEELQKQVLASLSQAKNPATTQNVALDDKAIREAFFSENPDANEADYQEFLAYIR